MNLTHSKKWFVLTLSFLLTCCFLTACTSNNANDSSASADSSAAGTGISSSVDQSVPASNSAEISSSSLPDSTPASATLQSVTGVIEDSGMGRYYVRLPDDRLIEFSHDGVDQDALTDTRPGSPITVTFTGTLQGTDTSGITVVRMETP